MINMQLHIILIFIQFLRMIDVIVKLHSALPHATTRLLLLQLFLICIQINVTTYTKFYLKNKIISIPVINHISLLFTQRG